MNLIRKEFDRLYGTDDDGMRTIGIPITGGRMVFIDLPTVFSEQDHQTFRSVLTAMEPGLVYEERAEQPDDPLPVRPLETKDGE